MNRIIVVPCISATAARSTSVDCGVWRAAMATILVVLASVPAACGRMDDQEDIGVSWGDLGAFAGWINVPNGTLRARPALVKSETVGTTVLGIGGDFNIWMTNNNNPGRQWNGIWLRISDFGDSAATDVAATGFIGEAVRDLGNYAAIVVNRSHSLVIKIQDLTQVGSDIWHTIPGQPAGGICGRPAITYSPRSSAAAPRRTVVLVALGCDGAAYTARLTLTSEGSFEHDRWTSFTRIGTESFNFGMAITWACPANASAASLVAASGNLNGDGSRSDVFIRFIGGRWGAWSSVLGGIFKGGSASGGPALATACAEFDREISLFDIGLDGRIWVSTQISSNKFGFSPIGTNTFPDLGGDAVAIPGGVMVAAIDGSALPFSNFAVSP